MVTVYYSSIVGNSRFKKNLVRIQDLLNARKIEFTLVDVAQDEYFN